MDALRAHPSVVLCCVVDLVFFFALRRQSEVLFELYGFKKANWNYAGARLRPRILVKDGTHKNQTSPEDSRQFKHQT